MLLHYTLNCFVKQGQARFYAKGIGALICLLPFTAASQDAPPATETKRLNLALEGMIGVAGAKNTIAINVGGPNIRLKLNKSLSVGAGAFPSLLFVNGKAEPKLGLSPRIDYRNLVFIAPAYHNNSSHTWFWTYGLGYKFH